MQTSKFVMALTLFAWCSLLPPSTQAAERNKLIFISDLHMNMDASYAWLKTNAAPLAAFIDRVNAREDVAELVILGDMLDDWVEPVENAPHTFLDILTSPNNAGIIAALQAICQNTNLTVTYVVGNHDLLTFEPQNKATITNILPGLNIISDSPGLGAYTKNKVIWAEHGHRYCMFNAPDIWSRTNGHLPLGFFISRIAASKSVRDGRVYTTQDALETLIKSPDSYYTPPPGEENVVYSDEFVGALFDAFALIWGGYWPWDTFAMGNLDHFTNNPSVAHIGSAFDGIYSGWPTRMDRVDKYEAIANELGQLSSAADLIFEMPDRIKSKYPFRPRIVLFGHTHEAAFTYHCAGSNTIYANTGTWIDGKPKTWVEIEINRAGDKKFYTVSLWFDGESEPRQKATLDAPGGVRRGGEFAGWACGGADEQGGVLFCTTNGTDWSRQGIGQIGTNKLSGVAAMGGQHVWAVGAPVDGYASIYYSPNAGLSWARQGSAASLPTAELLKIHAVDQNTLWAVGAEGLVLVTDNGGGNWRDVSVPGFTSFFQGVAAVDAYTAWVSGGINPANGMAAIFYTQNGGATWTQQTSAAITNTQHILGLSALDENRVWAIGEHEVILVTTNAGLEWDLFFKGVEKDGNEICVLDDRRVWAALDARVAWTTNGGASWDSHNTAEYTMDVSTPDGTNIWAVSQAYFGGLIHHSSDGGVTWDEPVVFSGIGSGLGAIEVQNKPVQQIFYVNAAATNPVAPYSSWATAAANIQDAVDAAADGALVLVSNGVYDSGGRAASSPGSTLTNRVVIEKPIDVRSVNGPSATFIKGAGPLGDAAVRGAFIHQGSLSGFTITNGFTLTNGYERSGGGVFIDSGGQISNCVITGNVADESGGGILSGSAITHCVIDGNRSGDDGGGVDITLGSVKNCLIRGNSAHGNGGGLHGALFQAIENCLITGNTADGEGGGASIVWIGSLRNCTVMGNTAAQLGGGASLRNGGYVQNCILWSNGADQVKDIYEENGWVDNSCASDLDPGIQGCITNNPQFTDAGNDDYRLSAASPCINAGTNEDWMAGARDLAGNSRVIGPRVDMGAYEYPLAPDGMQAAAAGGSVHLGWSAPGGEAGIRVYRYAGGDTPRIEVASLAAGTTSWTDTAVSCGQVFQYWTRADYGAELGAFSAQALGRLFKTGLDFDGDGLADAAVYAPGEGRWYVLQSGNTQLFSVVWGWADAWPVAADYDGDCRADVAVYWPAEARWYVLRSSDWTPWLLQWGWDETMPVPADYDGDGVTDVAVYWPAGGRWSALLSSTWQTWEAQWGGSEAIPTPADYDGDGKTDLAVYWPENGTWNIWLSGVGQAWSGQWGWREARPVPADYDGDGKADVAVYWPAGGKWSIVKSSDGQVWTADWGWGEARPVPMEYHQPGVWSAGLYWPAGGNWYLLEVGSGASAVFNWGWDAALPVAPSYQILKWYYRLPG